MRPASFNNIFPSLLKRNGYNVAFIGKWGIADEPKDSFTDFGGFKGQGKYFVGKDRTNHLTQRLTNQSVRFIDRYAQSEKPFCLIVSYKAPHGQDDLSLPKSVDMRLVYPEFDVDLLPESYGSWDTFAKLPEFLKVSLGRHHFRHFISKDHVYRAYMDAYRKLIWGMDKSVGDILDFYKSKRSYERLEAFFISDNGMMTGQHGMFGKWLMYEDSIRIPFIWKPAFGATPPAAAQDHIALNIDLAPSVLHAAGVDIPPSYQGMAFQTIDERNARKGFFYSFYVTHFNKIPVVLGYKDRDYKYSVYPSHANYEQLFASTDEEEVTNLAYKPENREPVARYRKLTQKIRRSLGPIVNSA
jgi:arylsulfatase A-like enzyme